MAPRKSTPKTRRIKVTVAVPGSLQQGWGQNTQAEVITIAADYKVDLPTQGDWLEIEDADGGIWAFPGHLVMAVVTEADGS